MGNLADLPPITRYSIPRSMGDKMCTARIYEIRNETVKVSKQSRTTSIAGSSGQIWIPDTILGHNTWTRNKFGNKHMQDGR